LREPDWDLIRAFVRSTDKEDLRLRFGGSVNFGDEAALRRLFGVNTERGIVGRILDDRSSIAAILHHIRISRPMPSSR
jgi:putative aminopeptidase FrvX